MIKVKSLDGLLEHLKKSEKTFVLLYKSHDSEQSRCAYNSIQEIDSEKLNNNIIEIDVTIVKDIHIKYGITSVPTLLHFSKSELKNVIKGCHDTNYYKNIIEGNTILSEQANKSQKQQKSVVVYSTPSCSWCTTLKNYLKEHNVTFRDIDVSHNEKAASEMVKRSGQQGVPQTIIGGSVIIGFDKPRIDKLLGIQSK